MSETENHFPWLANLHSQLRRLSFGCSSSAYKKMLKDFESSVATEVIKLKSKPKRATKFGRILKSIISNIKLIQHVGGLEGDENTLSALGLVATHYIKLVLSSSMLDKHSAGEVANDLYSFVQIVLEQSREFILDTILSVSKTSENNSIVIHLLKNVLGDRTKYQADSSTFFKLLAVLKVLMEFKIAEKKIRKVMIETTFPKDFPALLLEKLKLKMKADDVDLIYVLTKLRPEIVIEECKSRLSVRGLEESRTDKEIQPSSTGIFLDSTPLFFIDVGSSEVHQDNNSEVCETSVSHHQTSKQSDTNQVQPATTFRRARDVSQNGVTDVTEPDEDESHSESEDVEEQSEEDNDPQEISKSQTEGGQASNKSTIVDNESHSSSEEASDIDANEQGTDFDMLNGHGRGLSLTDGGDDGVDYDENHENTVVTDAESSDGDIPLLDLDSDFEEESLMNSPLPLDTNQALPCLPNDSSESLDLPAMEEISGSESDGSDDTVELAVKKSKMDAGGSPLERIHEDKEEIESDSASEDEENVLDCGDLHPDENSVSSTDTVELSPSSRERPTSDSPKLTKAANTNETQGLDDSHSSNSTKSATVKSKSKTAPDAGNISPRRTRAASRQGGTTINTTPMKETRRGLQAAKKSPTTTTTSSQGRRGRKPSAQRAGAKGAEHPVSVQQSPKKESRIENENEAEQMLADAPGEPKAKNKLTPPSTPTKKASSAKREKTTDDEPKQIHSTGRGRGRKSEILTAPPTNDQPNQSILPNSQDNLNENRIPQLPTTPSHRPTRSTRASMSPANSLPLLAIKRTRKVSGPTSITASASPKKTKLESQLDTVRESADTEEVIERTVKLVKPSARVTRTSPASLKSTQTTGERYNLRRRSTHKK